MDSDANQKYALEEYTLSQESRHHHERIMWQLLGFHLAVTGILLQFWLAASPFTEKAAESNSFLVLTIPLLLGLFTGGALKKHRFFWEQELARAKKLEGILGFERESAFAKVYYSRPIRYVRSWDLAVIAVLATVFGMAYLIGRSLWFKSPILAGSVHLFPLYILLISLGISGYTIWRKYRVNKERIHAGQEAEIPRFGSEFFWSFWLAYVIGIALSMVVSFTLWWSLEVSSRAAELGQPFMEFWLTTTSLRVAVIGSVGIAVLLFVWMMWLGKRLLGRV